MLHFGDTPYREKSIVKEDGTKKTITCYTAENGYVVCIKICTPKPEDEREHEYDYDEEYKIWIADNDPMEKIGGDNSSSESKEGDIMNALGDMDVGGPDRGY